MAPGRFQLIFITTDIGGGGLCFLFIAFISVSLLSPCIATIMLASLIFILIFLFELLFELILQFFLLVTGHACRVNILQQSLLWLLGLTFEKCTVASDFLRSDLFVHCGNLAPVHDLLQFALVKGNNDILRLQISVDDATLAMEVVKSNKHLLRHTSHQRQWNTSVVVPLHNLKQVDTEDLKNHNEMLSIRPRVDKGIQKLNCVTVLDSVSTFFMEVWVVGFVPFDRFNPIRLVYIFCDYIKNLNLIVGCLCVV